MEINKKLIKFKYEEGDKVKLKKDKYFRSRERTSKLLDILCSKCNTKILLYQKDGRGNLHRCYIDRIYDPYIYSELQYNNNIRDKKYLPILRCFFCNEIIGYPMIYKKEGRLAYHLIYGKWSSKNSYLKGI